MKDIIQAISECMDLRQKIEWGVNTCINLRPYMREEYKKYNEQDIAIGQAWLNGKTEFKTGMFKKYKIEEYGGVVGVVGVEKQLVRSTINFGLELIFKNKSTQEKLNLLKSFAGLYGFDTLEYLEHVEELYEKTGL